MRIIYIDSDELDREKILGLITNEKNIENFKTGSNCSVFEYSSSPANLLKNFQVREDLINEVYNKNSATETLLIIINKVKANKTDSGAYFRPNLTRKLCYKSFTVFPEKEEVYIKEKRLKLTNLEYKLLLLFINNPEKIVTREEIIFQLWGEDQKPSAFEVTIYTHIKNLKKKIIKSGKGNFIQAVYGQGYRFEDQQDHIR